MSNPDNTSSSMATHSTADQYGFSREPESEIRLQYGRFRNVYLYITEECQLRCGHCYMGERLNTGRQMPFEEIGRTLHSWRKMGGSKLSILGGEPTLHPRFKDVIQIAHEIGFEKVILNTNGLASARRKLQSMKPNQFSYIQVSLDGGTSESHDIIRGRGTFNAAWQTTKELAGRGFDTRIICTVNRININNCMQLLDLADGHGVSLVKFHVFSGIGIGQKNEDWLISPPEWLAFCQTLESLSGRYRTQIWYQPTYARSSEMHRYQGEGYRGCIGRTLDRISIFPDGKAYVCSYLFDTNLNYAISTSGKISLNKGENEFDLFTKPLHESSCGKCKAPNSCMGGCPAESLVMGKASCAEYTDIIPICRLWKSKRVGHDRMNDEAAE